MSRWPKLRMRLEFAEMNYQTAQSSKAPDWNPIASQAVGKYSLVGQFGGRQTLGDVKVFWTYNVTPGYIQDPASPPKGNLGTEVPGPDPTPAFSWKHPVSGVQRVPGTEGDTELERAQGWGGNSAAGWNLWWGGGLYAGIMYNSIAATIPEGIDFRHRFNPTTHESTEFGFLETGIGTAEPGFGHGQSWNEYGIPNISGSFAFYAGGANTFRGVQNRSFQCPVYTGPEFGPKIFTKSTGNMASYEIPGQFPNAPYGSMMVRINLAYWDTTKRHVPETIQGGVPATGLGHDSWYVGQPNTPGMHRYITLWPDVGSYTQNNTNPINPIAITEGCLISVDVKYIGDEGGTLAKFGRFYSPNGETWQYDPSQVTSPGDKPHTHSYDMVTDAQGYTLSPPNWVSHMSYLVKGDSNMHAHTPFMGQFMGGPTSVTP